LKPSNLQDKNTAAALSAWFCVRTHLKHEHIAAAHLRKLEHLDVFLPRIRFRRTTHDGPVWFTEALFPNYLFARFELSSRARDVHHTIGVREIVHFGRQWPVVPDGIIDDLRAAVGSKQIHEVSGELQAGDSVLVSGGLFHNLRGLVTRVLPGRQRVAILLDFLGRQTAVELAAGSVISEDPKRGILS
jgi:transcriptional antiterminator RfaH